MRTNANICKSAPAFGCQATCLDTVGGWGATCVCPYILPCLLCTPSSQPTFTEPVRGKVGVLSKPGQTPPPGPSGLGKGRGGRAVPAPWGSPGQGSGGQKRAPLERYSLCKDRAVPLESRAPWGMGASAWDWSRGWAEGTKGLGQKGSGPGPGLRHLRGARRGQRRAQGSTGHLAVPGVDSPSLGA